MRGERISTSRAGKGERGIWQRRYWGHTLDRPLFPLTVALPRMLEKIEVDLATAGPTETRRLRQRAELIRELLTPRRRSLTPS